ncbi:MAG: hypothetical protein GXC76_02365 [Rhodanobacteraceae bacterium]|jgi:hypothetical protein|nr:hypothetical protein [Rhodanobacteraceae bacterium]
MTKPMIALMLLLAAGSAQAQSALLGKRLVGKGDDVALARDAGGPPDRIDRIDGDASTPAMEIWTWHGKASEVTLWVVAGKIVQAEERPLAGAAASDG